MRIGITGRVADETLLKIYAWYDNEAGYVSPMVDLASILAARDA